MKQITDAGKVALNLISERGYDRLKHNLRLREAQINGAGAPYTQEELNLQNLKSSARNARYHREVKILLALVHGEVPGVDVGEWTVTRLTNGYDVYRIEELDREGEEGVLFECDGGTITCERPGTPGDPDRVTFQVLFGNGPGELLADWSYSSDDAGAFGELIGDWFTALTED